jgi:hypothetical protein
MPLWTTTAEEYRDFGAMEARGRSPLYEELAFGVADDPVLIELLAGLPPAKRQPNLLFAATRQIAGTPSGYQQFRQAVLGNRDAVVATMLARRTQTNEPARCAVLYPLLASLPQPLALLEVGASAGLCLLPEQYRYEYAGRAAGALDSPLTIRSQVEGESPFGEPGPVQVAWRAGIDLNPLDVTDPDDVRWLQMLVWPDEQDRLQRLNAAIAVAQADPPRVVRGDLNARLGELAGQAPAHATLVVMHTAVLWYLSDADRAAFVAQAERLGGHWISQEMADVLPGVNSRLRQRPPDGTATYTVALDQHPVAFSALHGGWLRWL